MGELFAFTSVRVDLASKKFIFFFTASFICKTFRIIHQIKRTRIDTWSICSGKCVCWVFIVLRANKCMMMIHCILFKNIFIESQFNVCNVFQAYNLAQGSTFFCSITMSLCEQSCYFTATQEWTGINCIWVSDTDLKVICLWCHTLYRWEI